MVNKCHILVKTEVLIGAQILYLLFVNIVILSGVVMPADWHLGDLQD